MAGRFADGWVPQLLTLDALDERMDDLRRGASLGDRSIDDVRVALNLRTCAIDDAERAREYARSQIAFMIAVYGPFYRQAIADAGWADLTDTVRSRWHDGDREGAIEAVSDDLLDELVAVGTPEAARRQIERFEAIDGLDVVQVSFFGQMDAEERRATLDAVAPE